jgi:hypothetical protein
MATKNESGFKSFQATAVAIERYRRVKVDANGLISLAGNNDAIGVVIEDVAASGVGTVKLFSAPGTMFFTAAGAVTAAAALYPAANGKVDDAVAGNALGYVALEAATADGDIIEATPLL